MSQEPGLRPVGPPWKGRGKSLHDAATEAAAEAKRDLEAEGRKGPFSFEVRTFVEVQNPITQYIVHLDEGSP
jgi:hypothetical protein